MAGSAYMLDEEKKTKYEQLQNVKKHLMKELFKLMSMDDDT